MKKNYLILIACAILSACSKNDSPAPQPAPKPTTVLDINSSVYFKAVPQSASQLKISFYYDSARTLSTVYLKKDTVTIGTYTVSNDQNGNYSALVNYNFQTGQSYQLVVQSAALNDTAFRYTLPAYAHTFVNPYQYQQLLSLTQSLGPRSFDISPSRKTIFITDDVSNTLIVKRLSLTDGKIDVLPAAVNGLMIRAVSDSEVLSCTGNYDNRILGNDSTALMRYNINTGQSTFVDFVSASYARFSRVIDDHILVTEPTPVANSALINVKDNSKIIYPYSAMNFVGVGENNYDHIYYLNQVIDPATGLLRSQLPALDDSSGIAYIDNATQYSIVTKYIMSPNPVAAMPSYYTSRLSVYNNTNLAYQGDFVNTRTVQIGRQLSIGNNRILLYQSFGYDTTYRLDGYYTLDLNTHQVNLQQTDSNPYVIMDFQLDTHTMISVRADGVYRVSIP